MELGYGCSYSFCPSFLSGYCVLCLAYFMLKGSFFEVPEAIACRDSVLVVAQWWIGRLLTY